MHLVLQAYSQCEQLLDVESVGRGVFRPDVPDPEMSQASSTVLWELTLFRVKHHNISIADKAEVCTVQWGQFRPYNFNEDRFATQKKELYYMLSSGHVFMLSPYKQ